MKSALKVLKGVLLFTVAGFSFSFHAIAAEPTLVSVSPSSGNGQSQNFTVTVSDSLGASSITYIDLLINASLDGQNACWLYYDNIQRQLYLAGDSGWGTSNSHCTASLVSGSAAGNNASFTVSITFQSNWVGHKILWAAAGDSAGNNSSYQAMGTWDVGSVAAPVLSMSPGSGSGSSGTFTFTATGQGGASNPAGENVLINTTLNGIGACWLYFNGQLWLANDGATNWTVLGAGQSVLQNSQCTVSSFQDLSSGNSASFRVAIAFPASFGGNKNVYMHATNQAGANTGYQLEGTWNVPQTSVNHQATLSWGASTTPAVTYNVYRGTQTGGPYSKINPSAVNATTYADSSVTAGQTY